MQRRASLGFGSARCRTAGDEARLARLELLIRLSRRELDERRAELTRGERAVAEAERSLAAHDQRVRDEAVLARQDVDAMAAFTPWARRAAALRVQLASGLGAAQVIEAAAREAMREAFAALKRLELADAAAALLERREAVRRDERRAEEQAVLAPKPDASELGGEN